MGADPNAAQSLRNQEQFINPSTQNYDTSRTGANETTDVARLQNALQELGINPDGMSMSDMLNTYIEATNRAQIAPDTQITAENGMRDTEPIITPKDATKAQGAVVDTRLSNALTNMGSENERTTFGRRLVDNAKVLNDVLTGKNRLQPAYALADDAYSYRSRNEGQVSNPAKENTSEYDFERVGLVTGRTRGGLEADGLIENSWVRQSSKHSTEVDNISDIAKADTSGNRRTFTTILKGAGQRVADVVKKAIGLDVSSFDHTVDNYAMRHAMERHKDSQIPLKADDFKLIPDIIKNADSIEYSDKDGGAIVYAKKYGDRIIYLEEIRNKRRELAMKTMYWQPAKNSTTGSANPHLNTDTDSLRALPRQREDAIADIVSQTSENVNQTRTYNTEETLPDNFDVKHYVSDQIEAQKARSRVPLRERIADATAELKHYLVDDAVAYERYIKDKNERLNIREGVDRVRSSDMIASQWMKDHGLEEIGKMSDADLNEFQQYLIAKRALEVAEQGKATGRSIKITLVAMSDDIIYESKQRAFYGAKNLSKLCDATDFRRYVFY